MKIKKLNRRFAANNKWGYTHSIAFGPNEWRSFFAFRTEVKAALGDSYELKMNLYWRDYSNHLKTAPWAFHYENTRKPMIIYFRDETEMSKILMMFVLTGKDTIK